MMTALTKWRWRAWRGTTKSIVNERSHNQVSLEWKIRVFLSYVCFASLRSMN